LLGDVRCNKTAAVACACPKETALCETHCLACCCCFCDRFACFYCPNGGLYAECRSCGDFVCNDCNAVSPGTNMLCCVCDREIG